MKCGEQDIPVTSNYHLKVPQLGGLDLSGVCALGGAVGAAVQGPEQLSPLDCGPGMQAAPRWPLTSLNAAARSSLFLVSKQSYSNSNRGNYRS